MSCQWVNSYKRLVVGDEAPTTASWGTANRSALVRVPNYSPGKASSQRLEFRLPDSDFGFSPPTAHALAG